MCLRPDQEIMQGPCAGLEGSRTGRSGPLYVNKTGLRSSPPGCLAALLLGNPGFPFQKFFRAPLCPLTLPMQSLESWECSLASLNGHRNTSSTATQQEGGGPRAGRTCPVTLFVVPSDAMETWLLSACRRQAHSVLVPHTPNLGGCNFMISPPSLLAVLGHRLLKNELMEMVACR